MKSATIFTYNRSYNYGASLQSFALMQFIRHLGSECKVIDTRNNDELANKIPLRKDLKGQIVNIFNSLHKDELTLGRKKFNQFGGGEDRTINYSSNDDRVVDYEKLGVNPPGTEVYISGSDQVFSPTLMSPLYFFEFDTNGAKLISYAASIGVDSLPHNKTESFQKSLMKFHSISVREPSAKTIIQNLTGKPVEQNIDPTFLIEAEEWKKYENPYNRLIGEKYILAYFIYRPDNMNKWLKQLHKRTGLPIVLIDTSAFRNIYHNKMILDAGPAEFLWLVRNAEFVVTSSFHGTALSIIHDKRFAVYNNPATSSRIDNIISLFGLQNHVIKPDTKELSDEFYYSDGDRERISQIINSERERARQYLINNLE